MFCFLLFFLGSVIVSCFPGFRALNMSLKHCPFGGSIRGIHEGNDES